MSPIPAMNTDSFRKISTYVKKIREHPDTNVRATLEGILGIYNYNSTDEVNPLSWGNPLFHPTYHEFQQLALECGFDTGSIRDYLRHLLGMGELPLRYPSAPPADDETGQSGVISKNEESAEEDEETG